MNRYPWLDEALLALPGCEKDFKEEWGWHRYQVGGKLFAATCAPGPEHKVVGGHEILSVKCDPQLSELLRSQYPDIVPGFYMDKRCWISILLDGSVPDDLLRKLCADSYSLVFSKLTKKAQRLIAGE
ncbi:MAG: MmcQ/YjbR family DNA-binding protein [Clostridiales bacterium]|nr:MmcQ/YjbR family DNA-binding protein [Clostridiales bacterium]MDY2834022.1 MmcQ/YjbR family DNA-binding protein [Candidatus Aphodomonas sp.]